MLAVSLNLRKYPHGSVLYQFSEWSVTSTGALHSQQLYKAWGESRYTSGTLPTRYTYTGQYSYAGDFGLVYYGARFYDPLLARWASPDSIIPQNQGTLAWDRYSYVNNSPLNYTDPTGHMADHGCNTEGCSLSAQDKANENYNRIRQVQQLCQSGKSAYCSGVDTALQNADQWAWDHIPSAISITLGGSFQLGAVAEVAMFKDTGFVYNWRANDFSGITNIGPQVYFGTPNLLSGNIYITGTTYKGASENIYLQGGSIFSGTTVGGDALGKISISWLGGTAIEDSPNIPPTTFTDPNTNQTITYSSISVAAGFNLAANGIDVGSIAGFSGSTISNSFSEWIRSIFR